MANGGKVIIKILGDDKGFKSTVKSVKSSAVKALSVTTKAITAGTAALGGAIGFIGKQAISAYGDYEQLVGGVETLYKNSADRIIKNAQGAFKTAQMSSNEYMETVTGFAASLLQSLSGDTEKAAAMSDMALEDMADNANKMGTAMESIKWAYQGFAKQNYTMLDNLKLGYGGTKQEMERLVNDAAKLDKSVQANNLSFANIVNAVHAIQTEMGITGTTAEEAATTIQGSFNTLKASWQNLMTGLTDPNQNLDKLTSDVFESFKTFAGNVAPRLESVIPAVLEGGEKLCDSLVELLRKNSRRIGSTAAQLAGSLVSGFTKNAPKLVQAGKNIISGFADGVTSQFPKLTAAAKSAAMITGTMFAAQKVNAAVKITQKAIDGYAAAMTATGALATRGITINALYAASLKPLELIYGVLTGQISLATAATAAQTNAQVALNTALSANPIGIAVTAVAALAAGVYYADKAYDAWLDKHSELVQFANDIAQGAREATERTKELTGSINELYAQGRTKAGKIVTWTKNSRHTSRRAWDICRNVKGREYSDTGFFKKCGAVAAYLGITWGGTWKVPDMPHFEVSEAWEKPKTMREELTDEMTAEEKARLDRIEEIVTDIANGMPRVYHYTMSLPDWARATVQKLLDKGLLCGAALNDLNLSEDVLRVLVINDRAGIYD